MSGGMVTRGAKGKLILGDLYILTLFYFIRCFQKSERAFLYDFRILSALKDPM